MPDEVQPAPGTERFVPAGGFSSTITGAAKIIVSIAILLTGWTVGAVVQSQLVEAVALLLSAAISLWGSAQVYYARRQRGDVDFFGQRVRPVVTIVNPPVASESPMLPAMGIAGLAGWLPIARLVLSLIQLIAQELSQQGRVPAEVPEGEWRQRLAQALIIGQPPTS
jgi:hypothetical protein